MPDAGDNPARSGPMPTLDFPITVAVLERSMTVFRGCHDEEGVALVDAMRSNYETGRAPHPADLRATVLHMAVLMFEDVTACLRRCHRRDDVLDLRRRQLLVHLRRHPLHAAGAALQRPADRSRVAGRVADLDRARWDLPGAGHPWRRQGRDGDPDDADRRRSDLGNPGSRPRTLPRQPARSPSLAPGPRSRSSRSQSPGSPAFKNTRPGSRPGS